MRDIRVSTEVFAAIWAQHAGDERDEDAILRKLLKCGQVRPQNDDQKSIEIGLTGFFDARNGVNFPPGFKIFRSYKGKRFEAVANNGLWHRQDNGKSFNSLNSLNGSIASGAENVWIGSWRYQDTNGTERSIDALRR